MSIGESKPRPRRTHGTGSIIERYGSYWGQWWTNGRQVQRKLGPVRKPGTKDGMTKAAAERMLRAVMAEYVAPVAERITLAEAGQRLISHLTMLGRKLSTLEGYRSYLEIHLVDFFGEKLIHEISKTDIERFVEDRLSRGQSVKSVRNYLGLLHSILEFALRRGWVASKPCKLVDKPQPPEIDADVHFLDQSELDALLRAVPDSDIGHVDRVMYTTAAMTGLRQESWSPFDGWTWIGSRSDFTFSQNYVHGQFATPKSKRSGRSVPLADALDSELDRLHRSRLQRRLRPRVCPPAYGQADGALATAQTAIRPP